MAGANKLGFDAYIHGRTDKQADKGNDNTRRPNLASDINMRLIQLVFESTPVLLVKEIFNKFDIL